MSPSDTISTACPYCHKTFAVPASAVGRRGVCDECGERFYVNDSDAPPLDPIPLLPNRKYASVHCPACDTLLYGHLHDVGRKLRCPDCGTLTELRPPAREPQHKAVADVEAYELAGDDDPVDAFVEKGVFSFPCPLCESLLEGSVETVGAIVVCGDCEAKTRVPSRPTLPASDLAGRALAPNPESEAEAEYELDEIDAASEDESRAKLYAHYTTNDEATEEARIERVATNRKARPKLPDWPTAYGVLRIFGTPGMLSRVLGLSTALTAAIAIGVPAAGTMYSASLGFGMAYAIVGVCFLLMAAVFASGAAIYLADMAIKIVTESSEGNDHLSEWPSANPIEWMSPAGYLFVSTAVSAIPGWFVSLGLSPQLFSTALATSCWMFLPVVLLSQLETGQIVGFLAPSVLGRIPATIVHWFIFYAISGLSLVGVVAVAIGLALLQPLAVIAAIPLFVLAIILYFRGVGRLAWTMAGDR